MSIPSSGTRVAHYEVIEEIGRGGMGVVFRARDTKLNRTVALKFLPAELTRDEEATVRFVREAQAAAAIDHPNICSVHEISESADGQTFIVMGYYGGETLQQRIAAGPVEPEEAARIVSQIAEGLAAAHGAGIVHRDIKPGNVILTDDGRVLILDFGLAKLASGVDITREGSTSGTAAYMSPEQVNGVEVDHRSDLWSLGVVLQEMITGKRPFVGDYDQAVAYAIVNKEAESLRSVAPEVPDVLAATVEKALQKDPAARFQSAHELREALASITAPEKGSVSFADQIRRPVFALPAGLIILALLFIGWRLYESDSKERWAREVALPEILRLADERERAEAFRLAVEAMPFLEGNPSLDWAMSYVTARRQFVTEPPGASVYWKRYNDPDERWAFVGTTPTDSVLFPREIVRVRIEKEGYETVERLVWDPADDVVKLFEKGAEPQGMVYATGGEPNLRVAGIDHNPRRELKAFLYDQFEITNVEYKAFIDAGGYEDPSFWAELPVPLSEAVSRFVDRTGRTGPSTWEAGDYPVGEGNYPVAGVSWYEAAAYASWAGKELPTVYHWNAAAWTPSSHLVVPGSNLAGDGPAPVGSEVSMTRYGQYDLAGNVREWTYNEGRDGQRFILGGGWNDPAYAFNDAYSHDPFDRSETNGFRTIRYLDEEPNREALRASLDQPFRDYSQEQPVSDAEFEAIRRTYDYDKTPLNAEIESVDDAGQVWRHETITFDAAYGEDERVILHLYLPMDAEPPYQTIVFFPGSNAIYRRSYDSDWLLGYLDFWIRDGRAFAYPIYKGTFERGTELESDYPDETVFYKDHVNMWVKDLRRSVDYLETREDIDADNLAYFGWSWGALLGPLMTALEPRFKVQVLNVAGLLFQRALPEADPWNFLPHVTAPTLMLNGRYDFFFPLETSQMPFYENLGLPEEQKRMVVTELGHTVTRELLMRESFVWLDKWLDERDKR